MPPSPRLTVRLLVRVRAPAAGPPPGGGDERRSTPRKVFRLSAAATERPATAHSFFSGRAGACRRGRRGPTSGRLEKPRAVLVVAAADEKAEEEADAQGNGEGG